MKYGTACLIASRSWDHTTEELKQALARIERKQGKWTASDLLDMSTLAEAIEIREWN